MKTLAICNHKGGTGKTTTAIHIAAALGLSGHRTLVVDLDPQSFLTRMLGVADPEESASSLMLFEQRSLKDIPTIDMKGFKLLPSSLALTRAMRRLNKPTDVFWLKEGLDGAEAYDFVLFDTAAAVTVFSLNALVASDHVLIPVTPEYQPVLGAEQTFQTVKLVQDKLNPALAPPLFLFTQVDARKRTHHQYRAYFRKTYGEAVMRSVIRTSASLSSSLRDGSTTFDTDPYSRGARDYANATDELLRSIAPSEPLADATGDGTSASVSDYVVGGM